MARNVKRHKKIETPKDLGLNIVPKEGIIWKKVVNTLEQQIKLHKEELAVQTEFLKVAKRELLRELGEINRS